MESKGLGDTIEKITTATGIKKIVNTLATVRKTDCGLPIEQHRHSISCGSNFRH